MTHNDLDSFQIEFVSLWRMPVLHLRMMQCANALGVPVSHLLEGSDCDERFAQFDKKIYPDSPDSLHQWLVENLVPVRSRFIKSILKKVIVSDETLTIEVDAKKLSQEIATHYEINIGSPIKDIVTIEMPFRKNKVTNGAIVLNGDARKNKDPFDIPTDLLKRIVRGIVWRDEHFAGATLKDIAQAKGYSENHIYKCIRESFDFLSQ